ncbi:MAG: DMT family transporter [Burkholderiaceae bacterium]|nr:DMT family transporter [Burkholderiaceae bacterium]
MPHAAQDRRRHRIAQLLLWTVPLVWSSNYLIARAAAGVIHPHLLALARWSLALAIMLPLAWRGLAKDGAPWLRDEWQQLLVLGGLGMWICGAFVYIGGQTTSSANIALIYAATPIAIAVVGAVLLNEHMTRSQAAGVALALAGLLFVIARGEPRNLLAVRFAVGDLWVLAAGLSWTAYSVLLRRWPTRLGTAERLVAITAGGIVVLLPFTALECALLPPLPFTWKAAGLVLAAAVLPGVLAYQAYSYMLRELGAAKSGLVLYLGPVYAAFTAWALLGEPPQWFHAVGAALILPSIWVATRGR